MEGNRNFRIGMALAAFVLTLIMCLGGYHLYKSLVVARPLQQSLEAVPGIQKARIEETRESAEVIIWIDNNHDLKTTYRQAEQEIKDKLGEQPFTITVKDSRESPELKKLYDSLELTVYQGLANNSFLWLDKHIHDEANSVGANYHLQVDQDYMYISLSKNGHTLSRIIARAQEPETAVQGR